MHRTQWLLVLALLAVPSISDAAPRTWSGLVDSLVSIINSGIATIVTLALVAYFYGVATNILKFEDNPDKKKAYFFWGIIILFVMVSVWGILNLVKTSLFGSSAQGTQIQTPSNSRPELFAD